MSDNYEKVIELLISNIYNTEFSSKWNAVYPVSPVTYGEDITTSFIFYCVYKDIGYKELEKLLHELKGIANVLSEKGIQYHETALCDAISGLGYRIAGEAIRMSTEQWNNSPLRHDCFKIIDLLDDTEIFNLPYYTNPLKTGQVAEAVIQNDDFELFKKMTDTWDESTLNRTLVMNGKVLLPLKKGDIDYYSHCLDRLLQSDFRTMKSYTLDGLMKTFWSDHKDLTDTLALVGSQEITKKTFEFCLTKYGVGSIYDKRRFLSDRKITSMIKGSLALAVAVKESGITLSKKDVMLALKPFSLLCKHTNGEWEKFFTENDLGEVKNSLRALFDDIDPSKFGRCDSQTLIGLKNGLDDNRWLNNLSRADKRNNIMNDLGV